ncbi:probable beta-D-xylosidase 6 [Dendrobium catenatum]|uniref:Putative beta-D-xylosidase 6 n=1 Tax=Dendrobium catenatum TaxID=906689 RepID=A0A2I0W050_9ASPA|nr:probable beta-D-xylosidase 6 [Dendrobium catenatum]PKU69030.1 putative beta-D-xylosidase 6 [Dendrobium catenatum]
MQPPRRRRKIQLPLLLLLLFAVLPAAVANRDFPCKPPHFNSFPFCNTSLPIADRVRSLISLLTLQEKIKQLSNTAAAVPRLGLPLYEWWSESLHGVAGNGPGVRFNGSISTATVFPQVILSAASFNRTLWRALARAIAIEARAMYNADQAGLTFWAPNINIFRDPRWGRGQETPGEDPMAASVYAVDYVSAFQSQSGWNPNESLFIRGSSRRILGEGGDRGLLMMSACCKHYTAYDLEKWGNFTRYTFDAQVSDQDMEDTFQPPFRSCIKEGGASCLMCSYNQVNGVPSCARGDLLTEIREQWGFEGYVTSDCDAVAIIFEDQKYASSPEDAVADVLKAGMDINCGKYLLNHTESAVKLGKVKEEDIDRALFNLFSVLFRLKLFDGNPAKQQYGELGAGNVCTKEHRQLALEAARQGVVLLKNEGGRLPLRRSNVASMALIGPAGNRTEVLGGGYSGVSCDPKTLLDGLRDYVPSTAFAAGCANTSCVTANGLKEAVRVAGAAEVVVVVAGLNLTEETEDHDRVSLLLPGKQKELVHAIASASKKPLILVLMGGGPLDVSFAKEDSRISAIIWIGYPGEVGGQVLAEALFGDFNPGGRLPVTWYPESFTTVPMNDMNMRANPSRGYPGRTYRFYSGKIVYEYGYGLSYSSYAYKFLSAPSKISLANSSFSEALIDREPASEGHGEVDFLRIDETTPCEDLQFTVKISVANNGEMEGSHAILLFSRSAKSIRGSPKRQLVGFDRAFTAANGVSVIEMLVDPCKHMSSANEKGKLILVLGTHMLVLGDTEHELLICS